jgi:hypothetical protein
MNMFARKAVIVAAMIAGTAAAVSAGPPWISIEYPTNPHHASTRDASLLIRTYHHTQSIATTIDASAVGVVDGKRMKMALDVRETVMPGVYALRTALPKGGTWVFAFTMRDQTPLASALVTVNRDGVIASVTVPGGKSKDGWVIPRAATPADIEAALRSGVVADAAVSRATNARAVGMR